MPAKRPSCRDSLFLLLRKCLCERRLRLKEPGALRPVPEVAFRIADHDELVGLTVAQQPMSSRDYAIISGEPAIASGLRRAGCDNTVGIRIHGPDTIGTDAGGRHAVF